MIALLSAAAWADTPMLGEAVVVGASVVVALGPVADGGRVGGGVDLGFQLQRWLQQGPYYRGVTTAWAEERLDLNYGPVAHVWRVEGGWQASAGARLGATWPLRMGLNGGWWPGPGLTVELAPALSTAGWVGLDGQVAVDLPWVQGRVGVAATPQGLESDRVAIGLFAPLSWPRGWDDVDSDVWDPDRTPPGP